MAYGGGHGAGMVYGGNQETDRLLYTHIVLFVFYPDAVFINAYAFKYFPCTFHQIFTCVW